MPEDSPAKVAGSVDAATDAAVVAPDSYLTLHYRVSVDPRGTADATASSGEPAEDVVSTFDARPATLQLGGGQLSPALEEQLLGLQVGEHRVFTLSPGAAFGPRNPALVQRVSRQTLEADAGRDHYLPGEVVEFNAPGGGRYAGVLQSLDDDDAVFDFNHPLAGQPVRFEVLILGIL